MNKSYHTHIAFYLFLLIGYLFRPQLNAQNEDFSAHLLWKTVAETDLNQRNAKRRNLPEKYRSLQLQTEKMDKLLAQTTSPNRGATRETILPIPMPDGSFQHFAIEVSSVMHPDLAAKYPAIKTYKGKGVDDPHAHIFLDRTPAGFHALILSPAGSVYIDPYFRTNTDYYVAYYRKDQSQQEPWACGVTNDNGLTTDETHPTDPRLSAGTARQATINMRTYRIAIAAQGEYTAFHGGTVEAGLAAINTTLNRVRGIFETEVAVSFTLVSNNDLIIYTDALTDPYSNNNASSQTLDENQANLDAVIGNANYDIGHVFNTGGGGRARLSSLCNPSSKGEGVTGLRTPLGDVFNVDFVAHEIGHQLGASHTFNGNSGNCAGNTRTSHTAYEPGSGSTIMGYAGTCGNDNLQSNSAPYFHLVSLNQINTFVTTHGGSICGILSMSNNKPVANANLEGIDGKSIPAHTPFELTGTATDADGDHLTYSWEQWDLGPQDSIDANSTTAPIFRSFEPTTTPTRIFPQLSDILNNTTTYGEILPEVGRNLTFQFIARDNHAAGGYAADAIDLNVVDGTGPFQITNLHTPQVLTDMTIITWDVAGTTVSPINCGEVDIYLSTDGGLTFPTLLADNTSNDGTEQITLPLLATPAARFKIKCADNVFFDINDTDLTIVNTSNSAGLNYKTALILCNGLFNPTISLVNSGTTLLTSVEISYHFNQENLQNYTWKGSLMSGQATLITLPALSFNNISPSNTFEAFAHLPNGQTDTYMDDDTIRSIVMKVNTNWTGGEIAYVNAHATGNNDGTSWEHAFTDLQAAIDLKAVCFDNISSIWVASGTYYPSKDIGGNTTSSQIATLFFDFDVKLLGGFSGIPGTEGDISARDLSNKSILSGDLGILGDNTDNAYHVVYTQQVSTAFVMDGFQIIAGNANGGFPNDAGGGWYNESSSNPTIKNCSFLGNIANFGGGGMFNNGSSGTSNPSLTNCSFLGNIARSGGGMYNYAYEGTTNPSLTNCSFSGNFATNDGGGMYNNGRRGTSNPTLTNCSFSGNFASDDGGGMYNSGYLGTTNPSLTNCSFSGNFASDDGGGMYNNGYLGTSNPSLTNCLIWNNKDNSGIGIGNSSISNISDATTTITYSLIQGQNPIGTGNLDGTNASNDPLFVTSPDPNTAPTIVGDLHLQPTSPAIDKGTNMGAPTTDLDGTPRPLGEGIDLGAFEYIPPLSITLGATANCVPNSTYTQAITVAHPTLMTNGMILLNGQSFPITSNPQTLTLTNLPADGNPVDVTVSFSENDVQFTYPSLFTAPNASCLLCDTYISNDTPISVTTAETPIMMSTIHVPQNGVITDVNIKNLNGWQNNFGYELMFILINPQGIRDTLIEVYCEIPNRISRSKIGGFYITLDDELTNAPSCPFTEEQLLRPQQPLSMFNDTHAAGDWVLIVKDLYGANDLRLDGWELEICSVIPQAQDPCEQTTLTLNDTPIPDSTYRSGGTITSAGTIPANGTVTFKAETAITLKAGFHAAAQSIFTAVIEDCTPTTILPPTPATEVAVFDPMAIQTTEKRLIPTESAPILGQLHVFPNPFNHHTQIRYQLERATPVAIRLFDLRGKEVVKVLPKTQQAAGQYGLRVEAAGLQTGMYFLQVETEEGRVSRKLVLVQ